MHSLMNRANTLLTFFGTVAATLCVLTALTDLIHKSNPRAEVSVAEIKKLVLNRGGQDQVILTFNLNADLTSVFSWNTKQLFIYLQAEYNTPDGRVNNVVLWDAIVQKKSQAVFNLKRHKPKYPFIDHSRGLTNTNLTLTLYWNIMPYVGYFQTQSKSFDVGKLPASYTV